MASLFKRPTSQYWFACYRNRMGRQIRKSTKTCDKSSALKISIEWERMEHIAKQGAAAVSQFQRVVSRLSQEVLGEALPSQSIEEYLTTWLTSIESRLVAGSMLRYRLVVRQFLASLGTAAKNPVRGISPVHIERFLNDRLQAGVAPKTAVVAVKILGTAFLRAERFGEIERNPVRAVTLPKVVSVEREAFSFKEVEALVTASADLDWQTVILLGAYTGARLGDCVRMTWDNIDAETGFLRFEQKKTGRKVAVPLHPRLVSHLDHLSNQHAVGPLCPKLIERPINGNQGLSEGFKRVVRRAGLDLMVVQGKGSRTFARRTFHSLRHGFISALANSGVSEEVRMKLTGHATAGVHQRYTHLNPEPLKEAIRKMG